MARQARKVDPIKYHDVTIALSKARAAQFLLSLCDDEGRSREDEWQQHLGWLEQFGHDALTAALAEAETAFRTFAAAAPERRLTEIVGGKE